jgi:ribosomal protein S27AE
VNLLTLNCPNCGAGLEISPDMESFACGYCGSQQRVERRGGTVSLKLVTDAIAKVQAGTDRTASELAISRLATEIGGIVVERQRLSSSCRRTGAPATLTYGLGFLLLGGAVGGGLALYCPQEHVYPLQGLGIFVGFVIFFVGIALGARRESQIQDELKADLKEKDRPYYEKEVKLREELARHRDIVSH